MVRIIDKRGCGKSSRLMLMAKENNAIIACSSPNAMHQKANAYGIVGLTFISYYDFYNHNYEDGSLVYVDEIEGYLRFLHPDFGGYSLTNED